MLQALSALSFWQTAGPARAQDGGKLPTALGYLPWWMAAGWQGLPWNRIDRVVLFDAPIQRDGGLLDREWTKRAPGLAAHATAAGVPMDVALTLVEDGEFDRVFGESRARRRLLSSALRWIDQPFVAGLHLDVEGFSAARPAAIGGFREWLHQLDERRRQAGKGLSAFFPASDKFTPYDSANASRIDYWVAQVYDAHWAESKATGPLVTRLRDNPVAVQRALARLQALGVARSSVLLSVPLYGWEWPSDSERPAAATHGRAKLLTFAETPESLMPEDRLAATLLAQRHGLRRDAEDTPYYAYRSGAHWVQGWYEDVTSLTRKLGPERRQGYAGLAFFALGYDKGEIVEALLRWWRSTER
jgi:hypothetical protein